ncbi:hypothetical protein [Mucilaginibacter defluvii]|uniref:Uncharacterized protein n=1 Tax=Mucilaginibacter defluvii TaxID=1196019 RepID=A0ABP9FKV2_9SPHI
MILIDTAKPKQKLILTLSEKVTVNQPEYLLAFTGDATNDTYQISLSDKLSASNSRYDLFTVDTSLFNGIPAGYYTYQVYQYANSIIETGKLLIQIKEAEPEIISPIRSEEYLIYKQ